MAVQTTDEAREELQTYFDVNWLHSEMDWLRQEIEDRQADYNELWQNYVKQGRHLTSLMNDNQAQILVETLGENDRLKTKINKLLEREK